MTEKEENGQSRSVEKFIVHKNFKCKNAGECEDIGLIKVAEPFEFNKNVTSIKLPPANEIPKGESTLFGWGNISTNKTAVHPSVLQVCIISYSLYMVLHWNPFQTANLSLLSFDICEAMANKLGKVLVPIFICTDPSRNVGGCNGDSGGPLVQYKEDGEPDLIGIVTGAPLQQCGLSYNPPIYTRVSAFIDWINENMQESLPLP